jgi:hypothetical protein
MCNDKSIIFIFNKYRYGDKIEDNQMGATCRTQGKHKSAYNILITKPNKKRLLETTGVDGRTIKMDTEIREQDVEWIRVVGGCEHHKSSVIHTRCAFLD